MPESESSVRVVDNSDRSRYRAYAGDELAGFVTYRIEPGVVVLVHTEVPDEMSGQGIGCHLVRSAVRRARSDHLTIVPWCPFARGWLKEHQDAVAGLTIDWDTPPPPAE